MKNNPFYSFIDLVNFDQNFLKKEHEKDLFEKEIHMLEHEKSACIEKLSSLKQAIHTLKKEIDACDLDIKVLIDQEKGIEKKRDAAQSVKAFDALNKEMNVVASQRNTQEDILLQKWELLEEKQAAYDQESVACDKMIKEIDQVIAEKMAYAQGVVDQLKGLAVERKDHLSGIPQEWLDNYNAMKARVDDPVVPIKGNVCTACFSVVPSHDLQELKRHCILPCKSCYRLLYSE